MGKNKLNHDYFKEPTIINSYYAGYFAADGYIYKSKSSTYVGMVLNKKDSVVLKNFKKELRYIGPIHTKRKDNTHRLIFTSKVIAKDLKNNFFITERKTFTLKPPKKLTIPHSLAFIIGYIDGDGCISQSKAGYLRLEIAGTLKMLKWIREIFNENILFKECNKNIYKNGKIFVLSYESFPALRILSYLSTVEVPKLKRKWSKLCPR